MQATSRKTRKRHKSSRRKDKARRKKPKRARAKTPSSESYEATIPQRERAVTPDMEAYEAMVMKSLQTLPPRPKDMSQHEQIKIVGKGMGIVRRSPERPKPRPPRDPPIPMQAQRQERQAQQPRQRRPRTSVSRSHSAARHADYRDDQALRQIDAMERKEESLALEAQERANAWPRSPNSPDRESPAARQGQHRGRSPTPRPPSPVRESPSARQGQNRGRSPIPRSRRTPPRRSREQQTPSLVPRTQTAAHRHYSRGSRTESQGASSSQGRHEGKGSTGGYRGKDGLTWNPNRWNPNHPPQEWSQEEWDSWRAVRPWLYQEKVPIKSGAAERVMATLVTRSRTPPRRSSRSPSLPNWD